MFFPLHLSIRNCREVRGTDRAPSRAVSALLHCARCVVAVSGSAAPGPLRASQTPLPPPLSSSCLCVNVCCVTIPLRAAHHSSNSNKLSPYCTTPCSKRSSSSSVHARSNGVRRSSGFTVRLMSTGGTTCVVDAVVVPVAAAAGNDAADAGPEALQSARRQCVGTTAAVCAGRECCASAWRRWRTCCWCSSSPASCCCCWRSAGAAAQRVPGGSSAGAGVRCSGGSWRRAKASRARLRCCRRASSSRSLSSPSISARLCGAVGVQGDGGQWLWKSGGMWVQDTRLSSAVLPGSQTYARNLQIAWQSLCSVGKGVSACLSWGGWRWEDKLGVPRKRRVCGLHNGLPVQAVRGAVRNVLPDQVAQTVHIRKLCPKNLTPAQEELRPVTHSSLTSEQKNH